VGVTPSGPVKANSGVRSGVAAAGKVLEGDDQQIYVHYITTVMPAINHSVEGIVSISGGLHSSSVF